MLIILSALGSMAIGNPGGHRPDQSSSACWPIPPSPTWASCSSARQQGGPAGASIPTWSLNAYSSSMFTWWPTYSCPPVPSGMILLLWPGPDSNPTTWKTSKGLQAQLALIAGMMLMLMFSMAGIPFFVGFFAKFAVLQAVVIWLHLAGGGRGGFLPIGAFYYLRVVKLMYFDAPADDSPISAPLDTRLLVSANALVVALLGFVPGRPGAARHRGLGAVALNGRQAPPTTPRLPGRFTWSSP